MLKPIVKTSIIWLALLVGGCSAISGGSESSSHRSNLPTDQPIQWPQPPQKPRVTYLYSITSPESANIKSNWLKRAWRSLVGKRVPTLRTPQALHVDASGRIYVIDSATRKIHLYDASNSTYFLFPQKPVPDFEYPVGITSDDHGTVYVSDAATHRIHIFSDYGKTYQGSFGSTKLTHPTGLALRARNQELLVVDTEASNISVFDVETHERLNSIGKSGLGPESLHFPTAISTTRDGGVLITDSLNFRIQRLNHQLQFVQEFGAAGDGPGYFSRPKGVASDSDDHIYVVDALFDNVQIFNQEGALLLTFGKAGHNPGEFWLPNDIVIDRKDLIYVTDSYNSRIQVFQYLSRNQ